MPKYSFDFKLKVVKEYLEGETGGYKFIQDSELTEKFDKSWSLKD